MQLNASSILKMRASRFAARKAIVANRAQVSSFSSQIDHDDDFDSVKKNNAGDIEAFRAKHQITLKSASGKHNYPPIATFDEAPFADSLKRILKSEGFTAPTPTQAQSWPIAMAKRDIISVARTGSGKTCGFLLPGFQRLVADKAAGKVQKSEHSNNPYARDQTRNPTVLILAPTRELTVQIDAEAQKYARSTGFVSTW